MRQTRDFTRGAMEIDLDDRLIPSGFFREAINAAISRSENADVGALETLLGNTKVGTENEKPGAFVIGMVADSIEDKVYWFFVGERTEGIYEFDISPNFDVSEDHPNYGQPKDQVNRILEFSRERKIFNFRTSNYITGANVINKVLYFNDGLNEPREIDIERYRGSGAYYLPNEDGSVRLFSAGTLRSSSRTVKGDNNAVFVSSHDPEYDRNENPIVAFHNPEFNPTPNYLESLTLSFASTVPEDLISLAKAPPLSPPVVTPSPTAGEAVPGDQLYDKFLYFATRYIYRNNAVSQISPWSDAAFFPRDYQLEKDPLSLVSMVNRVNEVNITFNPGSEEVIAVEVLVTEGLGTPVFIASRVDKTADEVPSSTPFELSEHSVTYGENKAYLIVPEREIGAINNVPVRVRAQEVAGDRLVFGNYTINLPVKKIDENGPDIPINFSADYHSRINSPDNNHPVKTVKSNRDYELAIVYKDRFGRPTTPLTSPNGGVRVPFNDTTRAGRQHINQNTLQVTMSEPSPYWATHYQFAVKYNSQPFYNLVPKAVSKDNESRRLYLRLDSGDINKFTQNTKFVLKTRTSGGSVDSEDELREFRVDIYGGEEIGFTTDNTITNFNVPFNIAQDETGFAFAPEVVSNSITDSFTASAASGRVYELDRLPSVYSAINVTEVRVNGTAVTGSVVRLEQGAVILATNPTDGHLVEVDYTYTAVPENTEAASDFYIALVPLESSDINVFTGTDESVIFETSPQDSPLDQQLFYPIGPVYRCFNGAHSSIDERFPTQGDQIQEIIKVLGSSTVSSNASDGGTVLIFDNITNNGINTLDVPTGIYTVTGEVNGRRVVLRNVNYERVSLESGRATIPESIDLSGTVLFSMHTEDESFVGDAANSITIDIDYWNAIVYGLGMEVGNIRGEFNTPFVSPGIVAAFAGDDHRELENRARLIHSGIINDDTSINRLHEFNLAEPIQDRLDIADGSIQKLHFRDTNLYVFQEDKVKVVPINANVLTTGSGGGTLTADQRFFGREIAIPGEYGISLNPESFMTYGNVIYWADRNRGALLKLEGNQIQEISRKGVESFVRSRLRDHELIIGSYDDYNDQPNFTFRNRPNQPTLNGSSLELIIAERGCFDPRGECNIVSGIDRDASDITTERIYAIVRDPLRGVQLGDRVYSNSRRTIALSKNNTWHLIILAQEGTPGSPGYVPANNQAIQINSDGYIVGIEAACTLNQPPDTPRELFAMSATNFDSQWDACASGTVDGHAYHDGVRDWPEPENRIYATQFDAQPLIFTGYRLFTRGNEKWVMYVRGGVVQWTKDCDVISMGRKSILGSNELVIAFSSAAERNTELCGAPFAEQTYWFTGNKPLPELNTVLHANDHNNDLAIPAWDADVETIVGRVVTHLGGFWRLLTPTATAPALGNENWEMVANGNLYIAFANGFFVQLNVRCEVTMYGNCAEELCFPAPTDLITGTGFTRRFTGIVAEYPLTINGRTTTVTEAQDLRNGRLEYHVVQGGRRFPAQGEFVLNAQRNNPKELYFDTRLEPNNTTLLAGDRPDRISFEPNENITIPFPTIEVGGMTIVDPEFDENATSQVNISELCYRGIRFTEVIGDPVEQTPPTVSISISPSVNNNVSDQVTLTATVSDDVTATRWYIGDLTTSDVLTGNSLTLTTTTVGLYTVRVQVINDEFLTAEATQAINFLAAGESSPTVAITQTPTGDLAVGATATLGATITPVGGTTIASRLWTLPAGLRTTSANLTGTTLTGVGASVRGTYTVTLSVTDSDGNVGVDTHEIEFTSERSALDQNVGIAAVTASAVTDAQVAAVCGGAGGAQTASEIVYYDTTVMPRQYFQTADFTGSNAVAWGMPAGNYGVVDLTEAVIPESEGGSIIQRIETIDANGVVQGMFTFTCNVPHTGQLGYADNPGPASLQLACDIAMTRSTMTPDARLVTVYADQQIGNTVLTNNFSAIDANPVSLIYERNSNGEIVPARDGYWTDGVVVRRSVGGVLRPSNFASCTMAVTANLNVTANVTAPAGVTATDTYEVITVPSGTGINGTQVGTRGEIFSITSTIRAKRGYAITPTYDVNSSGTFVSGNSYTFTGTFETGDVSETLQFNATTVVDTSSTAHLANLDHLLNIIDINGNKVYPSATTYSVTYEAISSEGQTPPSDDSEALVLPNDDYAIVATIRAASERRFATLSALAGGTSTNLVADRNVGTRTGSFTMNQDNNPVTNSNVSEDVTFTGVLVDDAERYAEATLTVNLRNLTGSASNVNASLNPGATVVAEGLVGESYELAIEIEPDDSFVVVGLTRPNPSSSVTIENNTVFLRGVYTTTDTVVTEEVRADIQHPSFNVIAGTDKDDVCERNSPAVQIWADSPNFLNATRIFTSATSTSLRTTPGIYYIRQGRVARPWNPTEGEFNANESCPDAMSFRAQDFLYSATSPSDACGLTTQSSFEFDYGAAITYFQRRNGAGNTTRIDRQRNSESYTLQSGGTTDLGLGFNNLNGKFTAPESGTYTFEIDMDWLNARYNAGDHSGNFARIGVSVIVDDATPLNAEAHMQSGTKRPFRGGARNFGQVRFGASGATVIPSTNDSTNQQALMDTRVGRGVAAVTLTQGQTARVRIYIIDVSTRHRVLNGSTQQLYLRFNARVRVTNGNDEASTAQAVTKYVNADAFDSSGNLDLGAVTTIREGLSANAAFSPNGLYGVGMQYLLVTNPVSNTGLFTIASGINILTGVNSCEGAGLTIAGSVISPLSRSRSNDSTDSAGATGDNQATDPTTTQMVMDEIETQTELAEAQSTQETTEQVSSRETVVTTTTSDSSMTGTVSNPAPNGAVNTTATGGMVGSGTTGMVTVTTTVGAACTTYAVSGSGLAAYNYTDCSTGRTRLGFAGTSPSTVMSSTTPVISSHSASVGVTLSVSEGDSTNEGQTTSVAVLTPPANTSGMANLVPQTSNMVPVEIMATDSEDPDEDDDNTPTEPTGARSRARAVVTNNQREQMGSPGDGGVTPPATAGQPARATTLYGSQAYEVPVTVEVVSTLRRNGRPVSTDLTIKVDTD